MLDHKDFNFGYDWTQDGAVMYLDHLWMAPEQRGQERASHVLDTLVRVAHYEGAEVVEVSIGGGERAEAFLVKNGFRVIELRS